MREMSQVEKLCYENYFQEVSKVWFLRAYYVHLHVTVDSAEGVHGGHDHVHVVGGKARPEGGHVVQGPRAEATHGPQQPHSLASDTWKLHVPLYFPCPTQTPSPKLTPSHPLPAVTHYPR